MDLGMMWSWSPVFPGRIPLKARNTARGEPMQKKFSTCSRIMELYYMDISFELITMLMSLHHLEL